MNAFLERWVQSLQVECLDRFVVFGEKAKIISGSSFHATWSSTIRTVRTRSICTASGPARE